VAQGAAFLALILVLAAFLDGAAYWIVAGCVALTGVAVAVYVARQGMKATVTKSDQPPRREL
jgi:hypothetical protein